MNENQLKRQHALDSLEIAIIDLRNNLPLSQVMYNIETAMLCLESLKRQRKDKESPNA